MLAFHPAYYNWSNHVNSNSDLSRLILGMYAIRLVALANELIGLFVRHLMWKVSQQRQPLLQKGFYSMKLSGLKLMR